MQPQPINLAVTQILHNPSFQTNLIFSSLCTLHSTQFPEHSSEHSLLQTLALLNNTAQRWPMVCIFSLTWFTSNLKVWWGWFAENKCMLNFKEHILSKGTEMLGCSLLLASSPSCRKWDPQGQFYSLISRHVCHKPLWAFDISDVVSLKSVASGPTLHGVLKYPLLTWNE